MRRFSHPFSYLELDDVYKSFPDQTDPNWEKKLFTTFIFNRLNININIKNESLVGKNGLWRYFFCTELSLETNKSFCKEMVISTFNLGETIRKLVSVYETIKYSSWEFVKIATLSRHQYHLPKDLRRMIHKYVVENPY